MRMLLVDDDADTRTIFRTVFELSGHDVLECGDGEDALRLAREHPLDVILLDMKLPGRDGWTITRALRQDAQTSGILVVAVSAHALPEHRKRATEAGCVGYVTKPVEPREVVAEVERIVRTHGSG